MITALGLGMSVVSFVSVIWAVVTELQGKTVAGWASTVCLMCLIGGIQMVCLGILGEYIGKIYMEVKRRPRYIISDRTWEAEEGKGEDGPDLQSVEETRNG